MRGISRRTFLQVASILGITAAPWAAAPSAVTPTPAQPQTSSVMRIAHLSRRQGGAAEMASYAIMGAQLGAEEANVTAGMFGSRVELIIEEATTSDNIRSLAGKLTGQGQLSAIIAALDDAETADLSAFCQQAGVVCLNTCARGGELRGEKCQRLTFHVEPDLAMYTQAMGQWLIHNKRRHWQFVVSEQPFGQEVYHRAKRLLQHQGGTELGRWVITPGHMDFKDVLAHVERGEAEAVVVALQGAELQGFLEQYKATGATTLLAGVPLDIMALWQANSAPSQSVWVTSWYHGLERFSARELNRRFSRRFEKPAEGFAWANWAAVKMVVEGVLRSGTTEAAALVSYLEGAPPFDGHKGKALTFRTWNHQLRQPLYMLKAREATPEDSRDLFQLIGELPSPTVPSQAVAALLDTLGEPQRESLCRLATP
jgi:ABC-type branched-subunit amino acid transport system substrate-binding protein